MFVGGVNLVATWAANGGGSATDISFGGRGVNFGRLLVLGWRVLVLTDITRDRF